MQFTALTAGDRTEWARARERFFAHGINKYSLDMIERALFVLVLDDRTPNDVTEQSYYSIHGNGYDRYFDKYVLSVHLYHPTCMHGVRGLCSWNRHY